MEKINGNLIGFKTIKSKKGNTCYIISILFLTVYEGSQRVDYFVKDIFVGENTYYDFIENHSVLDVIELEREVVNDKVRYYI